MIKKSEKLVITFYTTTTAMAMENLCKTTGAAGRIIPVPSAISADCGLAWCAALSAEEELCALMEANGIQCQGIYHCMV